MKVVIFPKVFTPSVLQVAVMHYIPINSTEEEEASSEKCRGIGGVSLQPSLIPLKLFLTKEE